MHATLTLLCVCGALPLSAAFTSISGLTPRIRANAARGLIVMHSLPPGNSPEHARGQQISRRRLLGEALLAPPALVLTGNISPAFAVQKDRVTFGTGPRALQVPPLGIGGWSWGDAGVWGYGGYDKEFGETTIKQAFQASLKADVTFFDTAEVSLSVSLVGSFSLTHSLTPSLTFTLSLSLCRRFTGVASRSGYLASSSGGWRRKIGSALLLPRSIIQLTPTQASRA